MAPPCAAALCHALRRLKHMSCGAPLTPVGGPHLPGHLVLAALPRRVSWLRISLKGALVRDLRTSSDQSAGMSGPCPQLHQLVQTGGPFGRDPAAARRRRRQESLARLLANGIWESWTELARSRGTPLDSPFRNPSDIVDTSPILSSG